MCRTSASRELLALFVAVAATCGAARSARAQDAPPITDNHYTLQFHQGPVTTATRMIGLGGAYAALAEYSEGVYANSASPAVRVPWSVSRFDYDLGPSLTIPGTFANTDFENRGRVGTTNRFNDSINLGLGLNVQYAGFGATMALDYTSLDLQRRSASSAASERGGQIGIHRGLVSLGYSLMGGQLLVGGGLRGAFFGVVEGLPDFSAFGLGAHIGAIAAPSKLPLRIGASYRDTVEVTQIRGTSTRADGAQLASGRILPSRALLPWELQLGVMLGLGGWPDNGIWVDPETDEAPVRRRYEEARNRRAALIESETRRASGAERIALRMKLDDEERLVRAREDIDMAHELARLEEKRAARWLGWSRRGVMIVADLLFTGSSPSSVGIEDFIDQRRVTFGHVLTASPRAGMETEVLPNWVKARTGFYVEPSRFLGGSPRSHFTGGLDFRLLVFNPLGLLSKAPLRLRLAADVAPRYTNFGFALGTWH